MSDDVRNAAAIGAAVDRSLGGIPSPRRKSKKKGKKDTKNNSSETPTKSNTDTAKPEKTQEVETPADRKPSTRTPSGKNATIKDVKAAIGAGKIDQEQAVNLSSGYARDFARKEVGRQFREYAGSYGTDRQPAVDLTSLSSKTKSGNEIDEVTGPINPSGNPTGKFINPKGSIF
jgi:hypothetical protein